MIIKNNVLICTTYIYITEEIYINYGLLHTTCIDVSLPLPREPDPDEFKVNNSAYHLFIDQCNNTKCEHEIIYKTALNDTLIPVDGLPAVDIDVGLWYINKQCAICNGAKNVQTLQISLKCNKKGSFIKYVIDFSQLLLKLILTTNMVFPDYIKSELLSLIENLLNQNCDSNYIKCYSECYSDEYIEISDAIFHKLVSFIQISLTENFSHYHQSHHITTFLKQMFVGECPLCEFIFMHKATDYIRPCYPNIIKTCKPFNRFYFLESECDSSYQLPTNATIHGDQSGLIYKNPYCSLCNNNSKLQCHEKASPRHELGSFHFSFSILLDFKSTIEDNGRDGNSTHLSETELDGTLDIVTIISCTISLICLSYRLFSQMCGASNEYGTAANRLQCNLVVAITIATLFQLFTPLTHTVQVLCVILGNIRYFIYLSTFSWMLCIAVDIYKVVDKSIKCIKDDPKRPVAKTIFTTWFIPFITSVLFIIFDYVNISEKFKPQFGGAQCWFKNKKALVYYFIIPLALCMCVNVILFVLTAINLKEAYKHSSTLQQSKRKKQDMLVYMKVFITLGLSWVIGLIAALVNHAVLWLIFTVLNASQGTMIILVFEVDWGKLSTTITQCCNRLTLSTGTINEDNSTNNIELDTCNLDRSCDIEDAQAS